MMGVIANPAEECSVREFFELFKIPWEFYRGDRRYEVLLCAGDAKLDGVAAKLVILYASGKTAFDDKQKIQMHSQRQGTDLSYSGTRLPIYGRSITFRQGTSVLAEENTRESVAFVDRLGEGLFARVGYDLFGEIRTLLTRGQPAANASIPALELHIAFLRDLITGCSVSLVEIPPVPDGHPFIACLTHDVDHPSIRRHKFDHTMFGFLYRATLGSLLNAGRGRLPLRKLFTNWVAAAMLPFIHLGLARDFWYDFDRYLEMEKGKPSTFFVIPFEGNPGRSSEGKAPRARASGYGASDIAEKIRRLRSAGCEIGLHGIDAWLDSSKGREEARRISGISGTADLGVRMHWLYGNEESAGKLEDAGFSYDSTVGYNETVGYRAGTTQAYKPLQAARLLELPLHVMDTALFYPSHLNLSPKEARKCVVRIADHAVRFGGTVTVNWHDRSIAPERLWDASYVDLVQDLKGRGAWFSTAGQAVSWFRKRRSAVFESVCCEPSAVCVKVSTPLSDDLPGLRLRVHKAREQSPGSAPGATAGSSYMDIGWNGRLDAQVAL